MRASTPSLATVALVVLAASGLVPTPASADVPEVTEPPESFFAKVRDRDRGAARAFYRKHIDIDGIPVAASGEVADEALVRTYDIVRHLLAGRRDIVQAMVERDMYLIIIGRDQLYTDKPEYRNRRARSPRGSCSRSSRSTTRISTRSFTRRWPTRAASTGASKPWRERGKPRDRLRDLSRGRRSDSGLKGA